MKSLNSATRIGTLVTAMVALLPYLSDFFVPAYLAGAFGAPAGILAVKIF
jgi:hypothetical protein